MKLQAVVVALLSLLPLVPLDEALAQGNKRRPPPRTTEPPAWLADAVFYHIFPERFRNGDPTNDPRDVRPWSERPSGGSFHGGDFPGITESLGYLADLGVTALYLNPIHPGGSNHKYNPSDYFSVAPEFGTLDDFRALVQAAHARGMKVVLDGVFHHTGEQFEGFRDAVARGKASPYWDWYTIHGYPVQTHPPNYETWNGHFGQPKLNFANPEVRAFVKRAALFWIQELDVDGWRLDVAESVPHDFWAEFRAAVKAAKPDAVILGEIWPDAQRWLAGDQFDTVTNYPLWNTLRDVIATRSAGPQALLDRFRQQQEIYRAPVVASLFNLAGSHDTDRFVTLCGGDPARLRLAYALLFTYPGAPSIYYGDEVALEGGNDPDNRRCFPWDELEARGETLSYFKRLGQLRRELPELRRGRLDAWSPQGRDGRVLCYQRTLGQASTLVVLNLSDAPQELDIQLSRAGWRSGQTVQELLGRRKLRVQGARVSVPLRPWEALILR
ncbi:MAG: glycoside hydrolase family 13 protein [Planctomycetes bacterium]|nr:glycoside hydrolase family 13 protein [Planctomycetota bacterium]